MYSLSSSWLKDEACFFCFFCVCLLLLDAMKEFFAKRLLRLRDGSALSGEDKVKVAVCSTRNFLPRLPRPEINLSLLALAWNPVGGGRLRAASSSV